MLTFLLLLPEFNFCKEDLTLVFVLQKPIILGTLKLLSCLIFLWKTEETLWIYKNWDELWPRQSRTKSFAKIKETFAQGWKIFISTSNYFFTAIKNFNLCMRDLRVSYFSNQIWDFPNTVKPPYSRHSKQRTCYE